MNQRNVVALLAAATALVGGAESIAQPYRRSHDEVVVASPGNRPVTVREGYVEDSTDPDPNLFPEGAVFPEPDLSALQREVIYPELARRAGVEGNVVIRVLVDEKGVVRRYRLDDYDSPLLVDAAVNAILSAPFTPGTINGAPARLWTTVPIAFRLN